MKFLKSEKIYRGILNSEFIWKINSVRWRGLMNVFFFIHSQIDSILFSRFSFILKCCGRARKKGRINFMFAVNICLYSHVVINHLMEIFFLSGLSHKSMYVWHLSLNKEAICINSIFKFPRQGFCTKSDISQAVKHFIRFSGTDISNNIKFLFFTQPQRYVCFYWNFYMFIMCLSLFLFQYIFLYTLLLILLRWFNVFYCHFNEFIKLNLFFRLVQEKIKSF